MQNPKLTLREHVSTEIKSLILDLGIGSLQKIISPQCPLVAALEPLNDEALPFSRQMLVVPIILNTYRPCWL